MAITVEVVVRGMQFQLLCYEGRGFTGNLWAVEHNSISEIPNDEIAAFTLKGDPGIRVEFYNSSKGDKRKTYAEAIITQPGQRILVPDMRYSSEVYIHYKRDDDDNIDGKVSLIRVVPASPPPPPEVPSGNNFLVVMSANLYAENTPDAGLDQTACMFSHAHVVFAQDVDHGTDRYLGINIPEELPKKAGFAFSHYAKRYDFDGGEYGIMILSRFPIISSEVHRWGPEQKDIIQHVVVEAYGMQINLFNTHYPFKKEDQPLRMEGSRLAVQLIDQVTGPVIFAGDFNARIGFPEVLLLLERLTDSFAIAPADKFNCNDQGAIDHVLFRGPFAVRDYHALCWGPPHWDRYQRTTCGISKPLSDHPFPTVLFEIQQTGQPPAVSGQVIIADFSSGTAPAQVRYRENLGQYSLLNGWHDAEDIQQVGNFMGLHHDQVLFINRLNQNNGRVLIADFSSGTPPAQTKYVERWGQFDLLDGWHDPEDIQLAGDYMKLGYDQVLFINTKDAGDGRVMIADFSGGPPAQVQYWENWGQSSLLNGWHDPKDIRLVGDFMHLGYDQVMFINVIDRKDGRVMIADFSSGTPPATIKYLEGWGQSTLLNGWHDDPEDFQLAGDFMNLGYDQVLFINGKDAGDGRVMIADFSSGAPPALVRYSEKWGQFPLLDAWHNPGDWLRAGDFMGLGYDQVLFINRLNQNDGRVMIADFSSGNGSAQVKYWENWGQSTLLDGWLDNPVLLMKGNFFGANIQLFFINQG